MKQQKKINKPGDGHNRIIRIVDISFEQSNFSENIDLFLSQTDLFSIEFIHSDSDLFSIEYFDPDYEWLS